MADRRPPTNDVARILAACAARGWTRTELAHRAGVGENTLANWVAGTYNPSPAALAKVEAALAAAPEQHFGPQLQRELARLGWGLADLAERIATRPPTMRTWLAGASEPMPHLRARVAAGFARCGEP